jgi:hypothetical protein
MNSIAWSWRSEWPPVAGIHRGERLVGSDMYPSECNLEILPLFAEAASLIRVRPESNGASTAWRFGPICSEALLLRQWGLHRHRRAPPPRLCPKPRLPVWNSLSHSFTICSGTISAPSPCSVLQASPARWCCRHRQPPAARPVDRWPLRLAGRAHRRLH